MELGLREVAALLARLRTAGHLDEGASAVEYGILAAAVAAVIVIVIAVLGTSTKSLFTKTNSCVATSGTATGC